MSTFVIQISVINYKKSNELLLNGTLLPGYNSAGQAAFDLRLNVTFSTAKYKVFSP
jgi:hypothetical protein